MYIPPDLVDAINANHAIAIVGSGVSRDAGAPSWIELLLDLLGTAQEKSVPQSDRARVLDEIGNNRFIEAADRIADSLGRHTLQVEICRAITGWREIPWPTKGVDLHLPMRPQRHLRPTDVHRQLVSLRFQALITTNYDRLLESTFGTAVASYSCRTFASAYPSIRNRQFILHLHGDVEYPGDIVFASSDYGHHLHDHALKYLVGLLSTSTALWLGYGHRDPDVQSALLASGLESVFGGYQLVIRAEADPAFIGRLERGGIVPIFLETYDEIPVFLRRLADQTGGGPGGSPGVPPGPPPLHDRGREISWTFLAAPLARLSVTVKQFVPPTFRSEGRVEPPDLDRVFTDWSSRHRLAIVAPPGAGKTVLLSRFARWLFDQVQQASPAEDKPLVIYLTPDSIPDAIDADHSLWEQIQRRADAAISGYSASTATISLDPWRQRGKVYVLFDGLDEFGARRQGELHALLDELKGLSEKRVRVLLTCREVFWNQQVRLSDFDFWPRVDVEPLSSADIDSLIPYPHLGPFAYDPSHKLRPGLRNHLIRGFVASMIGPDSNYPRFDTRFALYSAWAERTIGTQGGRSDLGVSPDEWLQLFKDTALALVESLSLSVPLPKLRSGKPLPFSTCAAMNVIVASADSGVKFYHESLNEFFLASALADDFTALLDITRTPETIEHSRLAAVDLDFLQPSVYGFLRERLGEAYVGKVLDLRLASDTFGYEGTSKVHRNLTEYLGMVRVDAPTTPKLVDWLLRRMADKQLQPVVRYNAARALERSHPWAPRPYFDYMSDWGDRSWEELATRSRKENLSPWAVRGYRFAKGPSGAPEHRIDRKPGRYHLAIVRSEPLDSGLQASTSKELARLIIDLLIELAIPNANPETVRDLNWLLINFSHAWVRWYHPDQRSVLEACRTLAKAESALPAAIENLESWVGHPSFSLSKDGT